jgi:hypothetical protein
VREAGELRLVLLCDRCGAERQEFGRLEYRPEVVLPGPQPVGLVTDASTLAEPKAA